MASGLKIQLDAAGPDQPVTFQFSLQSGDTHGRASGEGRLQPAAGKPATLENIRTTTRLHVENWPLENLSAIAAGRINIPSAAGRLDADGSLTGSGTEKLQIEGTASIKQLKLRGDLLGTDTPTIKKIHVNLRAMTRNGTLALPALTFQSSLVSGSIRGDIDDQGHRGFAGAVDVNLAEMSAQFPGTLKLQKDTRIVKGRLALAGSLESSEAGTSFEGRARIDRLQGLSAGKKISWNQPVTAKVRGKTGPQGLQLKNFSLRSAFLNADGRGNKRNMRLSLSADLAAALKEVKKFIQIKQWGGNGQLKLNLAVIQKAKDLNTINLKLEVNNFGLRHNRSSQVRAHSVRANFTGDGSLTTGRLMLRSSRVDIRQFFFRQNKKIMRDKHLVLTTRGRIDFTKKALNLAPVDIRSQAGKIHVPALAVANLTDIGHDIQARGTADLDLDRLAAGYGDFMGLPPGTRIYGNGHLKADMDFSNPKIQHLILQGQLSPFKLVSKKLPDITEKKVTFKSDVTRSPDGRHIKINQFELNSRALSLTADGRLDRVGGHRVFEATGTMTPDLALISTYLKKTNGSGITFAGRKATPFTIKLVSKENRWDNPLQHLYFSGSLHVTSIRAFGFNLAPNNIPIRIADGTAEARLTSPANGGELSLQPNLDMRKEPYVLSFPKNLDVLKQVQVTRAVAEGLLALIHPLFKEAVKPEGRVDLQMQYLNWPLARKDRKRASFAGSLRLDGIKINSTPLLSRLLSIMGVRQRNFDLGEQTINFSAENGRVKCSPLTFDVDGSPVVLYGSVGFDKTLDYTAKIPLTKKWWANELTACSKGLSSKFPSAAPYRILKLTRRPHSRPPGT